MLKQMSFHGSKSCQAGALKFSGWCFYSSLGQIRFVSAAPEPCIPAGIPVPTAGARCPAPRARGRSAGDFSGVGKVGLHFPRT